MNLWGYQIEAGKFVELVHRVYLALDMGMGKTLTSLAAGYRLSKKRILVVADLAEIENNENFRREVETHLEGWGYASLRDTKLEDLPRKTVAGINPDGLKKLATADLVRLFDVLIVDEATMAKNITTDRFAALRDLAQAMDYVILLSGTPMMNGAAELFAPLVLLGHPLAGKGDTKAKEAFETIFAGGFKKKIRNTGNFYRDYSWEAKGANHVRELRYLIKDQFFFKRKDETDAFKKKERLIEWVEMTPEWKLEQDSAWSEYYGATKEKHGSLSAKRFEKKMGNIAEMQRLIENGRMYQVNSKWKARQAIADIAAGKYAGHRLTLFTMFTETYALLEELLKQANISYRVFDDIKEWKEGDETVLLGRIKAHGRGGNAAEASICLMVDMDYVPINNIQAENRIDRPQQTRDMQIIYYMTRGDEIDEHVRGINRDKMRKIDAFMRPLTLEEEFSLPESIERLKIDKRYAASFKVLGITH